MKYFTFFLAILLSLQSFASSVEVKTVFFSIGGFANESGRVQIDDQGTQNSLNLSPFLQTGFIWHYSPQISLNPSFALGLPEEGRDPNISKQFYFLHFPASYVTGPLSIQIGTGLFFTSISGEGGTEELDNGLSTTLFPLPKSSVASVNIISSIGLEIQLVSQLSLSASTFIFNITDDLSRTINYMVNFSYHYTPQKTGEKI